MTSEYDKYVRGEWQMYVDDASRRRDSLDAVAGLEVRCVLDVGCGAGQELLPFVSEIGAWCAGADVAPESGLAARELFSELALDAQVVFVRAAAESLPFASGSFDVVICRLALPYTNNARCLSELSRVLRPGGALLLKIHHARYYTRKLRDGLRAGQPASALHATRVLVAGFIYQLTGRQPRTRIPSRETFQTVGLLRRELSRVDMEIRRELRDSNPLTPSFVIIKS
jgi:ubiquinone/menaquinone biosynthesis C-methylase UbiE